MVSIKAAREIALSFDEVTEEPHFEKASFRVKKKIYATLNEKDKTHDRKAYPARPGCVLQL